MRHFLLGLTLCASVAKADLMYATNLPPAVSAAIQGDMRFVAGIAGSDQSRRHDAIFGNVSGGDYLLWFTRRIQYIAWADQRGPSVAVAFFDPTDPRFRTTMFLRNLFVTSDLPQAFRVTVLWHEARHTEGGDQRHWLHVNCPVPFKDANGRDIKSGLTGLPLQGQAACDTNPNGAYGIAATMMGNIHKYCTNCTDKVKEDADIMFQDSTRRHPDGRHQDEIRRDLGRS